MEELIGLLDKIAKDIEFHSAIDDGDEGEIRRIADDYFQKIKAIYKRHITPSLLFNEIKSIYDLV